MKIICYTVLTENGLLIHYPSNEVREEILHLYKTSKDKYNGYFKIDIEKPYPPRTTGEGSQNNKFYALVTELCKATGNDIEDVKDALKEKAIKRGYPYRVNKLTGRIRPYSTTEVNTGQKWINNKPIYRKVITGTTGNTAGDLTLHHNINNLDRFIRVEGFTDESDQRFFPNFYRDFDSQYALIVYYATDTSLHISYGSSRTNKDFYVIVEYTKTTD